MLEPEEVLLTAMILYKKKRRRKYWTNPIVSERLTSGCFNKEFSEICSDEKSFYEHFRMSTASFDELLAKLETSISKQDTNMRQSISAKERLVVTLRYLASGSSMSALHYTYKIGISTLSGIIHDVCKQIWQNLKHDHLPIPDTEKWLEIAEGFENYAQFPNCLGAIDEKHVRIIKASSTRNHKQTCSMVLLLCCDIDYRITLFDIGFYDDSQDDCFFKNSKLGQIIMADKLNFPEAKPLPNTEGPVVPYVFVGDEEFGISLHITGPYRGKQLSDKKKLFNARLSRARKYVENTFGIFSSKWKIFQRPLNVTTEFAEDLFRASVILHNYTLIRDGFNFEDTLSYEGFFDLPEHGQSRGKLANQVRDTLADYFVTNNDE